MERFADHLMEWLVDLGYTHCFFLAGGGSMHLVDAASRKFKCVPTVHEVTAVIAAEYFNESSASGEKAFALVTTGPGLTNSITGIAGAWLESRELLVIGGQVKSADLATDGLRQRGIQEVDGISLVRSITKNAIRLTAPITEMQFKQIVTSGTIGRKGPVFIEVCIDASAATMVGSHQSEDFEKRDLPPEQLFELSTDIQIEISKLISNSKRPLLLLGAGVSREVVLQLEPEFEKIGLPIASTWSGADRSHAEYRYYAGRPNFYGMRWANIFQQQADLLIAVGTRLGLQQTGYNFAEFMPVGKIIHIDIDSHELDKSNPKTDLPICVDGDYFLQELVNLYNKLPNRLDLSEWQTFLRELRHALPQVEVVSPTNYVNPYGFIHRLSQIALPSDVIVPCSSGGTFTASLQTFINIKGQRLISNKGLASMGYGLAGAIGASLANPAARTILLEGDGGFAQNLQDLGTVRENRLNLKMMIFSNEGYASIRTSQQSYFDGHYVGCDTKTGLGLPNWEEICSAFQINFFRVDATNVFSESFEKAFRDSKPTFFLIDVDPSLIYLPRVGSKILDDGTMVSRPIHDMTPELDPEVASFAFKYLHRFDT